MEEKNHLSGEGRRLPSTTFPTAADVLVLIGLFFVIQVAVMLVASFVLLVSGQGLAELTLQARGGYLALTSLVAMGLTTATFLWYRHARGGRPLYVPFTLRRVRPALLGWAFVVMLSAGILLDPLYQWLPTLHQEVGRGLWSIVAVVVIAPLFEEYLCRGFLFGSLRERYGTTRAVLFSALFFGIMHVQPAAVVNGFVMGVVLAVVYAVTRTLWAPILLHAANNALAYLFIVAGYEQRTFAELFGDHRRLYLLVYAGVFVGFVASAYFLWRMLVRRGSEQKNRDLV